MEHRARALVAAAGLSASVGLLGACGPAAGGGSGSSAGDVSEAAQAAQQAAESAPASGQSATTVLAGLPVKGRAPMTGYARDQFGPAWADVDRNGCDTRNDVLARDLTRTTFKPGTHDCVVATGTLADPYTATTISFVRGHGDDVDIDHVVALGDAWQTGASGWDDARRTALANDPLNLLAVDASANRQKGDADAASWLPANRAYWCSYVARQVAVKAAYGLWVTPAEHEAIATVLATCPGQPVPAAQSPAVQSPAAQSTAAQPHATQATAPASGAAGSSGPYPNCAAARSAGAAPLHHGDAGWNDALDRDGDGTACE